MRLGKILLTTLMLISITQAKGYFTSHEDICDLSQNEKCTNNVNIIRNLQITLTHDIYTDTYLTADGKWGKSTKEAVIAFQEAHSLKPADGRVGNSTKEALDKIAKNIKFPKDVKVEKKIVQKEQIKIKKVVMAHKDSTVSSCGSYEAFKKSINLRESFKVYQDKVLLKKATGRNTKLKVDISEQRVRLYVNGKVALCSPCTTGAKRKFEPNTKIYRDKRTPKGTFRITEKIADKRSTIFGDYYRGSKRVYHGDKRKFRGSKKGLKYKGASLQNWMRLTSSGVGLHASKYVKRNPGTNGCIRLPYKVAKTIFKKVKKGTKVSIVN